MGQRLSFVSPTFTLSQMEVVRANESSRVKTFKMVAYSGGKLFVDNFNYPVVVDLNGVVVKAKGGNVNVTLDHQRSQRVGSTTSIEVTHRGILAEGSTSAATEARDEVVDSASDGFNWQASIEGRVVNKTLIRAGASVRVNGKTFQGPVYVARKFVLSAISFVSSGGDEENEVHLAAQLGDSNMTFQEWLAAKGFNDLEAITDEQQVSLKAWYSQEVGDGADESTDSEEENGDQALRIHKRRNGLSASSGGENTTNPTEDAIAEYRESLAADTERINRINEIAAGGHQELAANAIREGTSADSFELIVLRAERENASSDFVDSDGSQEGGPDQSDVLTAALAINSGVNPDQLEEDQDVIDAAMSGENKNATLHRLMYDTIRAAGMHCRPGSGTDTLIRTAVEANRVLESQDRLQAAGAGFSSITLPGVLGNVANKALLAAYNSVPIIATQVCSTRSMNDFKLHTSYRVSTQNLLEEIGKDGEIKHTELTESSYTNQLKTYARMIALTRGDMMNDDLSALTRIATGFGRVTAKTVDYVFHSLLLANTGDFFHADNSNYLAGSTTALSITSLTTAAQLFLAFLDDAGYPMMVDPVTLLVSNGNDVVANQLYNDLFVNETTSTNAPKPSNNPHVNKYRPITSPWLSLSTITGYSDLAWYLLADPKDVAFMEMGNLRGQQAPTIESSDTVFNTLGSMWRAYFDFSFAFQDPKGAVKMLGEAAA